ncbi:YebC/PmpR family DNA-binding transcriptional regulator [Candidatus Woesebacteria bacterium]|nr:YebC/PmpR family DNA-binding transcriptional regulator [Candidatus Woesebacteria bacterium]
MSGHSKWANIKRKKGVNDAQRSAVFTKMSRIISTAVHEGGGIGDPEKNFKLRLAVDRAKAVNMPKDTIQRAIDKAAGGDGSQMKELLYEGFGPHGIAILISATTDNQNRTFAEVKLAIEKNGGKMASTNAVAYQFTKCGVLELQKKDVSEEEVYAMFDEYKALDLEEDEEIYVLYIPFEQMGKVKGSIDVIFRPNATVELSEAESEKVEGFIEKLEELDDVMNVYSNYI